MIWGDPCYLKIIELFLSGDIAVTTYVYPFGYDYPPSLLPPMYP